MSTLPIKLPNPGRSPGASGGKQTLTTGGCFPGSSPGGLGNDLPFPSFGVGDLASMGVGELGSLAGSAVGGPFGGVVGDLVEKGAGQVLGALAEGGLDAALGSIAGALDPTELAGMLEGSASGLINGALSSLLAVNDQTPAGAAILKTMASKFQAELMDLVTDPAGALGKLNALITPPPSPTSSASVKLGMATPAGAGLVMLAKGSMACSRIGDMCTPIPSVPPDAGPFIQGNPTVIINGKPAAGENHLAVGLTKGTAGSALMVAPKVLMGTATVTDVGIYEKALLEAPNAAGGGGGGGGGAGKGNSDDGKFNAGPPSQTGGSVPSDPAERQRIIEQDRQRASEMCDAAIQELEAAKRSSSAAGDELNRVFGLDPNSPNYQRELDQKIMQYETIKAYLPDRRIDYDPHLDPTAQVPTESGKYGYEQLANSLLKQSDLKAGRIPDGGRGDGDSTNPDILVGNLYFKSGEDDRAGVLVHEASHNVIGTYDFPNQDSKNPFKRNNPEGYNQYPHVDYDANTYGLKSNPKDLPAHRGNRADSFSIFAQSAASRRPSILPPGFPKAPLSFQNNNR